MEKDRECENEKSKKKNTEKEKKKAKEISNINKIWTVIQKAVMSVKRTAEDTANPKIVLEILNNKTKLKLFLLASVFIRTAFL